MSICIHNSWRSDGEPVPKSRDDFLAEMKTRFAQEDYSSLAYTLEENGYGVFAVVASPADLFEPTSTEDAVVFWLSVRDAAGYPICAVRPAEYFVVE